MTPEGRSAAPLIRLDRVTKVYRTGKNEVHALRGVDLVVAAGEMIAIMGDRKSVV